MVFVSEKGMLREKEQAIFHRIGLVNIVVHFVDISKRVVVPV